MRKVILIFLAIIFIIFFIPIVFTSRRQSNVVVSEAVQENIIQQTQYNYKDDRIINLLHSSTEEVVQVPLNEYLYNVVSAEMPASFELEALKAQAVVARTYTMYKTEINKKHNNADICDSHLCCQAWISKEDRINKWEEAERETNWQKIVTAVDSTGGEVITYNGQAINAFFHSNSGGITEIPINVWGGSNYPYLKVVETSGEEAYSQYASEVSFTKEELVEKIKQTYSEIVIDFTLTDCIEIIEYTDSKRIKTIRFGNVNMSGVEARTILGLKSSNFTVSILDNNVVFSVIGYGHGVGMSQTGADALAKQGKNYVDIIHHFYKDVEIRN